MEIVDKNFKNKFFAAFQYTVKILSYYLHVSFLDIRKKSFIEFESDDFIIFWKEILLYPKNDLLEALCVGICEWMFTLEKEFWDNLQELHKIIEDMRNWLVKIHVHLEKRLKEISKKEMKELHKLSGNNVSSRFHEHLDICTFLMIFLFIVIIFVQTLSLEPYSHNISCTSNLYEVSQQN